MSGHPYRRDGCLLCELADVLEAREYELSEFVKLGDPTHREYVRVFDDRKNLGKLHLPGNPDGELL